MRFFYQGVRFLLKGYFLLFYRYKIYGQQHIPKGAGLIGANHASYLDPPLLAVAFHDEIHFLARSSLFKKPLFAYFIRKLNAHPLEQGDIQAFKLTFKLLKKNSKVVIFPEGERTSTGQLQPFKEGASRLAISAKVPIIPVYISGSWAVWPRAKKYPDWHGKITCVIGSPLYTFAAKEHKKKAQQELTAALKEKLEALKMWHEAGAEGAPP